MEDKNTVSQINLIHYRVKPLPTRPQRVVEYYTSEPKTRQAMNQNGEDYKGFWLAPEVKAYFDSRDHVIATNWSNRNFLLLLRSEAVEKGKDVTPIDNLLGQFKREDYLLPIELKGYVPEEVREAAQAVGGLVTGYMRRGY